MNATQTLSARDGRLTDETVLDLIRRLRNDLIKDFLDERLLMQYLRSHFGIHELALSRLQAIRFELKELLISPVNTNHYDKLILRMREDNSASLAEGNDALFYREIEDRIRMHLY